MPPTPYQILSNPPQKFPSLHPYAGPWLQQGLLPYLATLGGGGSPLPGAVVLYVSPNPGNVAAVGSEADPFNPTSAAAGFGGDPFAQAVAALPLPVDAQDEGRARCVFALGGAYPAPVAISTGAFRRFYILATDTATITAGAWLHVVGPSAFGNLWPSEVGVASTGNFRALFALASLVLTIGDNGTGQNIFVGCYGAGRLSVAVDAGGQAGQVGGDFSLCAVDSFNVPAPIQSTLEGFRTSFRNLVNVNVGQRFELCEFDLSAGGFTCANPSGTGTAFKVCTWDTPGPAVTFTGPAGSAQFDSLTAETFRALGGPGIFAGGAGPMDGIDPVRFNLDAVADTLAGPGVVTLEWAAPQSSIWSDLRVVVDTVPGPGPCLLTLALNGAPILPAPFDLSTLAPGVVSPVALVGLVPAVTGDALTATIAGPAIVGGDRVRLVLAGRADGPQNG